LEAGDGNYKIKNKYLSFNGNTFNKKRPAKKDWENGYGRGMFSLYYDRRAIPSLIDSFIGSIIKTSSRAIAIMPPIRQVGATFKKAEKFKGKGGEQLKLDED
jgi:hypothetical protein